MFPALQLLSAHADSKNMAFKVGICYPESRRKAVDFDTTYESGLVSNKTVYGFLRVSGESVAVLKIYVGSYCPNFNRALYAELYSPPALYASLSSLWMCCQSVYRIDASIGTWPGNSEQVA